MKKTKFHIETIHLTIVKTILTINLKNRQKRGGNGDNNIILCAQMYSCLVYPMKEFY
jgi:hypothetical protein